MNKFALISRILVGVLPLCASLCCPPEDDYNYENYQKTLENVSTVVNEQPVYNVGDTLIVRTSIDFQQDFDGTLLDLSEISVSKFEGEFVYNMVLNRISDFGAPSPINVSSENIVSITGQTTLAGERFNAIMTRTSDRFEHVYGIILHDSGRYSLGGFYNTLDSYFPTYYNLQSGDTYITIISNISPRELSGNFEFEIVD